MSTEQGYSFFYIIMIAWWFKSILVPLITVVISVFFKVISKPIVKLEKTDFFICFDLFVSAIFIFIIGMVELVNSMINNPVASILKTLRSIELEASLNPGVSEEIQDLTKLFEAHNQVVANKFGISWMILFIIFLIMI